MRFLTNHESLTASAIIFVLLANLGSESVRMIVSFCLGVREPARIRRNTGFHFFTMHRHLLLKELLVLNVESAELLRIPEDPIGCERTSSQLRRQVGLQTFVCQILRVLKFAILSLLANLC